LSGKTEPVEAAEPPVEDRPWFRLKTQRSVTLELRSKYATSGYTDVARVDAGEARALADALTLAADELDGPR
jgi:hypothetical protein